MASDDETMSTHWLQRALVACAAAGVPVVRLRERIGLAETAPVVDVERDAYLALWEELERISGDRALPVRAATHAKIERDDLLVFAVATCATVADACRRLADAIAMWTRAVVIRFEVERDGSALLEMRRLRPSARHGAALADEFVLADSLNVIRWMTGVRVTPVEVLFPHAAPSDGVLAPYRAFFGGKLTFAAKACALRLAKETYMLPLLRHDPWIAAYATQALRDAARVQSRAATAGVSGDVRRQLAGSIGGALPTLEQLAARLGVPSRTLRRRLLEEGTSFRALLDDVRRAEAMRLVGSTQVPLAEVAASLGFAHASTFHRAFQRWTGRAPSAFRAAP